MAVGTNFLCIVYQLVLTTAIPEPNLTKYHFFELPDAEHASIYIIIINAISWYIFP
jgi:hypothetical protein